MKKYIFEVDKIQWEKPTEPKYIFCAPAKAAVIAESEAEGKALAEAELRARFYGSGVLLGQVRLSASYDLPVDWSYGYGDDRRSGLTGQIGDLAGNNVIR